MKIPSASTLPPRGAAVAAFAFVIGLISPAIVSSALGATANPHIGSGVKHMLYVTDDHTKDIKIYDIDKNHELVRTLKLPELEADLETYRKARLANPPTRGPGRNSGSADGTAATKKGGGRGADASIEATIR